MPERGAFSRVLCVPEHTSQTLSRGTIMSPSALSSAGWVDRKKIRFYNFKNIIKNSRFVEIQNYFHKSSFIVNKEDKLQKGDKIWYPINAPYAKKYPCIKLFQNVDQ